MTLEQAPLLKKFFSRGDTGLCDHTLGGALMWRNCFHTRFSWDDCCLYFKSEVGPGKWAFTPPTGDWKVGIERLKKHCEETGEVFLLCSVSEEQREWIEKRYPGYHSVPARDWFDYLYLREKLQTLSGKKLSGQRNHRNYFVKTYQNWRFEALNSQNVSLAKEFFFRYNESTEKNSEYFQEEKKAVAEVLDNLEIYGFFGGMILVEDRVVAFSLGEIIGDTIFVHVEKADREYRGSYQIMVTEFLSHFADETVVYVNREEDVGDPGLRYSKEAYHPERLLAKYTISSEL